MSFIQAISGNVYLNDKTAGKTLRQLRSESRKLRNELQDVNTSSDEFVKKSKELRQIDSRYKELNGTLRGSKSSWTKAANWANKYAAVLTGVVAGISGVIISVGQWVKSAKELSDVQANVMKTTGLSLKEVRELQSDFDDFNTRTSRRELLMLAEEAGRLGYKSKKDVLEFVEAANMIKVALGDDLGGEEAIRDLGKLVETYKTATREGLTNAEAMIKVGSAINELSASGTTQASYLVDFTSRLSGAANMAKMTDAEILGLAATLDESGQKVEMSSTAVSQAINKMLTNTAEYAEIAGMSLEDFTEVMEEDANEAFLLFLEGLSSGNEGMDGMLTKLDGLGFEGQRSTQVLATLAMQVTKVREKQDLANDSFDEGVSLANEYNVKNENLAANLEKLGRLLRKWFVNSALMSGFEKLVGWMVEFTEVPIAEKVEKQRVALLGLRTELARTNTSQERRLEIIQELQETYPGFFKNIDKETATNTELYTAIEQVNEMLLKRIILEEVLADIQEQQEKKMEAMERMADISREWNQELGKIADKYDIEIIEGTEVEQANQILEDLREMQRLSGERGNRLVGGFASDIRYVFKSLRDYRQYESMANNTIQDRIDSLQEEYELYEKQIDAIIRKNDYATGSYEEAMNAYDEMLKKQGETDTDDDDDSDDDDLGITGRNETKVDIALKEVEQIENIYVEHYDTMDAMEKARLRQSAANQKKFNENWTRWNEESLRAKADLQELQMQAAAVGLGTLSELFEENETLTKAFFALEKGVAMAQVLIDLQREKARLRVSEAQAISGATALASAGGPAAVAAAIASTKALFEPMVQAANLRAGISMGVIATQAIQGLQSRYIGGYTGDGRGIMDEEGREIAGFHHKNEYVIPDWMMGMPKVANNVAMLEDIRTSRGLGGNTQNIVNNYYSDNSGFDLSPLEKAIKGLSGNMSRQTTINERELARKITYEIIRNLERVDGTLNATRIKRSRK